MPTAALKEFAKNSMFEWLRRVECGLQAEETTAFLFDFMPIITPPANLRNTRLWRNDITGLRALAVIPVLFFHAFPELVPGGFFGVDIFFVISGYLISGIIFRGLAAGSFSWISFYDKRIRRILPNLFLLLSAVLTAGWFLMWPMDFGLLGKHVFASGFFYENFQLLKEAGYFDAESLRKPLMHLWSLAIEEQFYIVFPLLCLLLWHTSRRILVVGGFVAVFTATSLAGFLLSPNREWVFYFPLTRFWELGAGILLSYAHTFFPREEPLSQGLRNGLSVAGLLVLVTLFFLPNASAHHPGVITVAAVASAVLLIAVRPDALINRTLLSWRPMTFVGLISYSLYLWHWPLLAFLHIAIPESTVWMRLALLGVAFVLATSVYFLAENPVRRMKAPSISLASLRAVFHGQWALWKTTTGTLVRQPSLWLLATVFALNCGAAVIRLSEGLPHRSFGDSQPSTYYFLKEAPPFEKDFQNFTAADGTLYENTFQPSVPALLMTGDSHMQMYLRRAERAAKRFQVNFENGAVPGCFAMGAMTIHGQESFREACREKQQYLAAGYAARKYKNIAIAEKWGEYLARFPDDFHETVRRFADYLRQNPDIKVWILLDPPWEEQAYGEGPYDPQRHVSRVYNQPEHLWFRYPIDLTWKKGNDEIRRMLAGLVTFIEVEPYICRNGLCDLTCYRNDDHLHGLYTEAHAVWIDPIFEAVAAQQKAD